MIQAECKAWVDEYFQKLKPSSTSEEYSLAQLRFEGYQDLLLSIRALLNVCILALEHKDFIVTKAVPQPEVDIQTVLELAVQLLPFEEGEFLDKMGELLLNKQEKV